MLTPGPAKKVTIYVGEDVHRHGEGCFVAEHERIRARRVGVKPMDGGSEIAAAKLVAGAIAKLSNGHACNPQIGEVVHGDYLLGEAP